MSRDMQRTRVDLPDPRQPHDDEDLALADFETGVPYGTDQTGAGDVLKAWMAVIPVKKALRPGAKEFPYRLAYELGCALRHVVAASSICVVRPCGKDGRSRPFLSVIRPWAY